MPDRFDAESDYVLQRIINSTNTAEGPNTPPRFLSGQRVPVVTAWELARTIVGADSTQFTLTWLDADPRFVDHYNIYTQNFDEPVGAIVTPYAVKNSPAIITVINPITANARITLTIQTVLKNGMVSPLASSPSVVGIIP